MCSSVVLTHGVDAFLHMVLILNDYLSLLELSSFWNTPATSVFPRSHVWPEANVTRSSSPHSAGSDVLNVNKYYLRVAVWLFIISSKWNLRASFRFLQFACRTSPTGSRRVPESGTGIGDAQSWSVIVHLFKQHVNHTKRAGYLNRTLDVQLREITPTLFQFFSLLHLSHSIIQLLGSSSESH